MIMRKTYSVQAIQGDRFEDILVTARSDAEAKAKAARLCRWATRWTRFVI